MFDKRTIDISVLELLRSNVLTLGKLEQVLLSVNNLDSMVLMDLSNISCVEPAILIQNLLSLDGVFVISREDTRSFNA